MNKVIVIDIDIKTIEEDQKILFDMGYRWNSSYKEDTEILKEYNFNENNALTITNDNIIFKIKKEHIQYFSHDIIYYNNIKIFSRCYKIKRILKKDT